MPLERQPSIPQLFASFLRLGMTAFGGPSMVAYIRKMTVEKKGWLNATTFSDGIALCQMIPGATAMQVAAYAGLKTRGTIGAAVSFIGFGLPAFVSMIALAAFYTHTHDLPIVASTFGGLQAIVVAIIANAVWSFGKTTVKDWKTLILAAMAAALFGLQINPIVVIFLAAVGGWGIADLKKASPNRPIPSTHAASSAKPLWLLLSVLAIGFFLLFVFNRPLFNLSVLLFRIDLLAFGGGFASVPWMLHEIVQVRHWIDEPTLMDGIVLGQITPGPIVITATFVGYLMGGLLGGFVATIAIFAPSFMLVISVSPYFDRLRTSPAFNKTITGVLCSFVGLLLTVAIRFALNVHWDTPRVVLAVGALVALLSNVDILWVVGIGTIASIALLR